ncbi:MAG: glycine zipper 2TM domain-containing protein [Rhodoferax sp.]|nr:glycine zipper 2TM domain-containing protein [Rhodoferax sp.]
MNTPYDMPQAPASANKPLWAAVAVLGVAVLAMGATLIRIQSRQAEPSLAVVPAASAPAQAASSAALAASAAASAALPMPEPAPVASPQPVAQTLHSLVPKKAVAPVHKAQPAPKTVAYPQPVPSPTPWPPAVTPAAEVPVASTHYPPVQVAKPLCMNCGVVESVTPVQREGSGSGLGAVAGAVIGGVLGNQVGGGDGKTAATVLGVFGGSIAGNAVEKKMNKATSHEVRVRMEDGSTRTLEQVTPTSVGTKVVVQGQTLQPIDR